MYILNYNHQDNTPSFVAVTASHDRHAFKYNTSLKIQPPTVYFMQIKFFTHESMLIQYNIIFQVEIITDLEEIMKKHLLYFKEKLNCRPLHIIIFRDGVSEGQFEQVFYRNIINSLYTDMYCIFIFIIL